MDKYPIDEKWKENGKLIQRAVPEGIVDEWNENISKLLGNKRFSMRFLNEAMTKEKKRMLSDNDIQYNTFKIPTKNPGDVLWAGDMKETLDFNKKRNF